MIFDAPTFRRLCQARDFLAADPNAPIRLAGAAANMSEFHFIRQYQALFGITPHQFRIALRMDRAKQLLASREMSVTETCFEVGMSSLGSFSDQFLRHVGASPSDFQRRARTMVRGSGLLPPILFPSCFNLLANLPPGTLL